MIGFILDVNPILLFFLFFVIVAIAAFIWGKVENKSTVAPTKKDKSSTLRAKNINISNTNSNIIIEGVVFPNINGLDYSKVISDFEDAEISLQKNIDKNWLYSQYPLVCLMKSFSKISFDDELKKLLSANNLKYSNFKLNGGVKSWDFKVKSKIPDLKHKIEYTIEAHEGLEFNLIFIINTSSVDTKSIELQETDLTSKKHKIDWVKGLTVFDGEEVIKKDNSLIKAKNVPLLFHDDESDLEYILIPNISHISHSKPIIDSIIKNNGGPKKFKSKDVDGWSNLYDGKNFTIGYVNEYRVVRLNKHRIIDSFEKLEDELSQLNESWNNIFNSRASWRAMSIKNLNMSLEELSRAHTNEYIKRYESGDNFNGMEDTLYRIDLINKFISKFEKYFEFCMNSGTKASEESLNKFFAIVESLIGTEAMLIYLMDNNDSIEKLKENDIFKREIRLNSKNVKDMNETNKKLVDIFEYTFYNDIIFNGVISYYSEENVLESEIPFRFGLKHGVGKNYHENGNLKSESLYFNDSDFGTITEYDNNGKKIKK